jgi:hypothetical protein
MFTLTTIQSSPSLIKHYLKRRSSIQVIYTTLNKTDDLIINNSSLTTNKLPNFEDSYAYNIIKDGSSKLKKKNFEINFFPF